MYRTERCAEHFSTVLYGGSEYICKIVNMKHYEKKKPLLHISLVFNFYSSSDKPLQQSLNYFPYDNEVDEEKRRTTENPRMKLFSK